MSQELRKQTVVFERIRNVISAVMGWSVAVLLTAMSAVVFINVISRYFLQNTLGWYEEVSRFMLIWIVFLGAVLAYIKGDHLGLDVILSYMKPAGKRTMILIADVLVIAALAVMLQGGIAMTADSLASGWVASSVPIPYGYVYMVGPISALLMLAQAVMKTVEDTGTLARTLKGGS